jgi:hypothetical protein
MKDSTLENCGFWQTRMFFQSMKNAWIVAVCFCGINTASAQIPRGFELPTATVSPNGKYGVLIPDRETFDPAKWQNLLIEIKTNRIVGRLIVLSASNLAPAQAYSDYATAWSPDSVFLTWRSDDKWEPHGVVAAKITNGKIEWQMDIMAVAKKEILARFKKEHRALFDAIANVLRKQWPGKKDVFFADVETKPLDRKTGIDFKACITSDLRTGTIDGKYSIQAIITGRVTPDGKIIYQNYRSWTPEDIGHAWEEHSDANDELEKLIVQLPAAQNSDEYEKQLKYWHPDLQLTLGKGWPSFLFMAWIPEETVLYRKRIEELKERLKQDSRG